MEEPDNSYYESNRLSKRWRRNLAKMIRELLPHGWEELDFLDVGVGDGYTVRLVKPSGEVSGIDFDNEVIEEAKRRGILAQYGSAYEIPMPDASYDIILCAEVLEHLDRPEASLKEIARVLRPGGLLVATTPVPSLKWRLLWWVWTRLGPGKRWSKIPHVSDLHIGEHSAEDGGLEAMLKALGFKIVRTGDCNYWMVAGLLASKGIPKA